MTKLQLNQPPNQLQATTDARVKLNAVNYKPKPKKTIKLSVFKKQHQWLYVLIKKRGVEHLLAKHGIIDDINKKAKWNKSKKS